MQNENLAKELMNEFNDRLNEILGFGETVCGVHGYETSCGDVVSVEFLIKINEDVDLFIQLVAGMVNSSKNIILYIHRDLCVPYKKNIDSEKLVHFASLFHKYIVFESFGIAYEIEGHHVTDFE